MRLTCMLFALPCPAPPCPSCSLHVLLPQQCGPLRGLLGRGRPQCSQPGSSSSRLGGSSGAALGQQVGMWRKEFPESVWPWAL
jgi:hypothetical protein